ncbi:MAG: peptidylprolyl isomerase [Planctomycetes bacterium]|nr:peptidylprolyl isomerase [Planctomycetota bacterium]
MESPPESQDAQSQLTGPATTAMTAKDLRSNIARLEQSRGTGGGYLQTLIQHDDESVRWKATMALGRMPLERYGRNVTGALEVALRDDAAAVRRAAAFSLGVRGDGDCVGALLQAMKEEGDADVRAQIWLAMGRLDNGVLRMAGLAGLLEDAPEAQRAACQAISTWPKECDDWNRAQMGLTQVAKEGADDVRWMALFTLARRSELRGDWTPFLEALRRKEATVWERLFATLGLARAASGQDTDETHTAEQWMELAAALDAATADPDGRVVTEALRGLAALGQGLTSRTRERVLTHPSKHVRAAGLRALAKDARSMEFASALDQDPSPMVRKAAFEVIVRLDPSHGVSLAREWARSGEYWQRRAVAEVATALRSEEASGILVALLTDEHPQVVGAALEALSKSTDPAIVARIRDLCGHEDNGISLAAVAAIGERTVTAQDLPFLVRAYDRARGDVGPEVRFNALLVAAKIDGPEPNGFLRVAASDEDAYVAQVALEQLTERGAELPEDLDPPGASLLAPETPPEFPVEMGNPRVSIETNRGHLVLELYPFVAPTHVHNFLTLAARGHYDGLTWHRVVSDFVVQGGCYRGDGNGSGTWRGADDSLAQEFNPMPYSAGALGMPRNQNPDSGGSQIFITHRPTPHLDARYTVFGQLIDGWETLLELEEGDSIRSVRRVH